jgi:hypothetical protein
MQSSLLLDFQVNPPHTAHKSGPWRKMLSSKDVNFVGYTYKNFEIVKVRVDSRRGCFLLALACTFPLGCFDQNSLEETPFCVCVIFSDTPCNQDFYLSQNPETQPGFVTKRELPSSSWMPFSCPPALSQSGVGCCYNWFFLSSKRSIDEPTFRLLSLAAQQSCGHLSKTRPGLFCDQHF